MASLFKSDNISYRPLLSTPRSLPAKVLCVVAIFYVIYAAHSLLSSSSNFFSFSVSRPRSICTPQAWASGQWVPKIPPTMRTNFTKSEDVYEFLGFQGCASNREVYWHLAADNERLFDRFPAVASWRWSPPAEQCEVRDLDPTVLVRDLVEQGGWLLIGDSVTENHFFSLSCLLYPHVRATPDYVANPYFDRGWPQNLYLDPASPLISKIKFPDGFDIETTPLVTFRRIDLLFEPSALDALYKQLHPDSALATQGGNLFSDEATWNLAPAEYVKIFTAPLPRGNYATMVVSTGGHWTTTLFAGLKDAQLPKDGIENVVSFFGEAMDAWAGEVQALLYAAEKEERAMRSFHRKGRPPRQVVARAYLPGHEDCHDHRVPDKEYKPGRWGWYNWNQIGDLNNKFEAVLQGNKYPDIHFLPIDRPALLRPDAHSAGDCLHIMTGAGVLEGWTQYIWHYVTVELPSRMR
ncbi:uncharacterized protein TRAVEDRAFT_161946 [Trametes versicolor FP-101664 SS1]|uniref:uncharacterized protein n=1 Tax=Trametes versicolor (strain FP-101664) TaxID=717944 RepID=UPI0004622F47|nr:uncharacterized protein TRAVEDRAFT_161946 [Trametes versicolor FP-101664 SS1]EIW63587.1 hypothetical protein TRAVEDRAFT_161946 [Trametes versicolor FP-101664 SS1]